MSFLRLFHALSTGAATFGLNPTLPPVRDLVPKTPAEALADDATKLKGDFDRALMKLATEVDSRGQSIEAKT